MRNTENLMENQQIKEEMTWSGVIKEDYQKAINRDDVFVNLKTMETILDAAKNKIATSVIHYDLELDEKKDFAPKLKKIKKIILLD